ncbi:hypothetical protein CPB85DRAFT_1394228 [Mucidula mucida]|nr:hypothetical protein CPB85DRAFT_1394228 [Mucidula mucida]
MSEEDRSAGRSDGAARSRASEEGHSVSGSECLRATDNASNSAAVSEPPEGIDNENEAAPLHRQQTSASRHDVPHQPGRKETFFGIPQSSGTPPNFNPNYDDDDYETRFPPDPVYQEASENARVFRVYMEESRKYDAYMTDEAREGLDVLLVFAGLFSAVLTTFVAQTSQSLQPDRATESTLLLREIAALQRAQMNGTSADSVPPTSADFTPAPIDVWVNGLWFTSLTLSLAAALFAVLIKQWLRQYMSLTSGTVRQRSLIRQFRFMGLQEWHVPALIGILPVLMHLSLAVFFVGLTLFLVPLRRSIAGIVGSASVLVFAGYIGTAVWPLFHIQCPYRTPLAGIIHWLFFVVRKYVLRNDDLVYQTLRDEEQRRSGNELNLEAHTFLWLLSNPANPTVRRIVEQAIGGLSRQSGLILDTLRSQSPSADAIERASFLMISDCFFVLATD